MSTPLPLNSTPLLPELADWVFHRMERFKASEPHGADILKAHENQLNMQSVFHSAFGTVIREEVARATPAQLSEAWSLELLRQASFATSADPAKSLCPDHPASLAWAWMELSDREKLIAHHMSPDLLVQFLQGSFELRFGGEYKYRDYQSEDELELSCVARTLNPENASLRQVFRALNLSQLRKGHAWRRWVKSNPHIGELTPLNRQDSTLLTQHLRSAKKQLPWDKVPTFCTTLGLLIGAPLASQLLPIGSGIAYIGLAALSAISGASLLISQTSKEDLLTRDYEKESKRWGRGLYDTLAFIYPEFEDKELFKTFIQFSESDLCYDLCLFSCFEKVGFSEKQFSKKRVNGRHFFAAEHWMAHDLKQALHALIESRELLTSIPLAAPLSLHKNHDTLTATTPTLRQRL